MGISFNPASLLNGQGIDVSSLVSQILSNSSGQLTEWQSEQTNLQGQASGLTIINSALTDSGNGGAGSCRIHWAHSRRS